MSPTTQATVFNGADELRVEAVPRPTLSAGEMRLQVARCGICGTDSNIVRGHFPIPNLPLVIGHELAGTVVEVAVAW